MHYSHICMLIVVYSVNLCNVRISSCRGQWKGKLNSANDKNLMYRDVVTKIRLLDTKANVDVKAVRNKVSSLKTDFQNAISGGIHVCMSLFLLTFSNFTVPLPRVCSMYRLMLRIERGGARARGRRGAHATPLSPLWRFIFILFILYFKYNFSN